MMRRKEGKKVSALVFALALAIQMTGCGGKDSEATDSATTQESVEDSGMQSAQHETIEDSEESDVALEEPGEKEESPEEDYIIDWKDGNFGRYMQTVTGITDRDIMASDVRDITELDLSRVGITDISALNELENLEELTLNSYSGVSLSLPKLKKLKIAGGKVNASALSELSGLTSLDLSGCYEFSDISGLSALSGLTELNLSMCTNISSIQALSELSNLTTLSLAFCDNISSLGALSGLSSLTSLDISGCSNISSIEALSGLSNLTSLNMSYCRNINNIDVLSGLNHLAILDLSYCEAVNLESLSGLSELTELNVAGVKAAHDMSNLAVFSEVPNLTKLTISDQDEYGTSTDFSILGNIQKLDTLKITGYYVDINALTELSQLTTLDLSNISVDGDMDSLVNALSQMPNLTAFTFKADNIEDVSALASLSNLKTLGLFDGLVVDFSTLSGMTNLEELQLRNCNISDVSVLSGLTNLRKLDLSYSYGISDVSPLSALENLETLDLTGTSVTDYSPVSFVPEIIQQF